MNTPADSNDDDLRCAEYALGVLDASERAAFEASLTRNLVLQRSLDAWQTRLAPFADDIAAIEPPARVWTRIRRDLGFLMPQTGQPGQAVQPGAQKRKGGWDSLNLWRWLTIGASIAALVLLGLNLGVMQRAPEAPQTAGVANAYMVATIARKDGIAHWTATLDMRSARMVVVPAVVRVSPANRSTELWLIPPNAKPIALGVFPSDQPATMSLPPEIMAQMSAKAVLAVSDEPAGGSPTGAPTGPVLATGAMHAT